MNYFAANIRYLRRIKKMYLKDFGALFGKGESTISSWESGKRSPTVNDTQRIASYFGITINDLLFSDIGSNPDILVYADDVKRLLEAFQTLPASQRQTVIAVAEGLVK